MTSTKSYSVQEVLAMSAGDLEDVGHVEIEGWETLPPEKKDQCMLKLRELEVQRTELVKSSGVDAIALSDKLNKVERSRSATPYNPYDPEDQAQLEADQEKEKSSYEALIRNNGRPCYPIEIGLAVFRDPGQYKDILEYWQRDKSSDRLVFTAQLSDWELFRQQQEVNRTHYMSRNRFNDFLDLVNQQRREYGLDGNIQLRENIQEQSKLDDWSEYQFYQLAGYKRLKRDLEKVSERLSSGRKALAKEGYSAFEEFDGLEFETFYSMTLDWGSREGKAKRTEESAERKVRISKKRSEAACSAELGEILERDGWIGYFVRNLESQRSRTEMLRLSAVQAKQDMEPYDRWLEAKDEEWEKKGWDQWTDEGGHLIQLETNSKDYKTRFDKKQELQLRASKALSLYMKARDDVELSEELLEAARSEDVAPTFERSALITRTEKEMRFAESHLEEAKELTKLLGLKLSVISDLSSLTNRKEEVQRYRAMLEWVEQQRQEIAGSITNQECELRRSKRISTQTTPLKTKPASRKRPRSDIDVEEEESIAVPGDVTLPSKTPLSAKKQKKVPGPKSSRVIPAVYTPLHDHPAERETRSRPSAAKSNLDPVRSAKVVKSTKQKEEGRRNKTKPRK